MKRVFVVLIFTFILIGCSNVQKNSNDKVFQLYKEWRLEELEEEIQLLNNSEKEKYELLLKNRIEDRKKIFEIAEELKENLSKNNIEEIEPFLDLGIKQNIVITQLKKINFANANIFSSDLIFYNNEAKNIIGINYETTTFYYEIFYTLKNKEWKITNFKEKRG